MINPLADGRFNTPMDHGSLRGGLNTIESIKEKGCQEKKKEGDIPSTDDIGSIQVRKEVPPILEAVSMGNRKWRKDG
jgi:hypothetical protein